jgi:peptidylprolyl isomerase
MKGYIMAQAKSGDIVKVHYTGKLDDGSIFDTSIDRNPLQLTIGENEVFPPLEQAIVGMETGESKTVKIPAEEAFGQHREDLIQTIGKSALPAGLEPEVGQRLTATRVDGQSIGVTVRAVTENSVTIDANHPLAGEDLIFDVELVGIL